MQFHSASVQVEIEKNGEIYNKSNFPIFFNSIASVKAEVKHAEIMKMEITLTPSFNDAILILQSGLLGLGKTDKKPQTQSNAFAPKSINPAGNVAASETSNDDPLKNALSGLPTMYIKFSRPGEMLSNVPFETPWFVGAVTQPDISVSGTEVVITLMGYAYGVFFCGPKFNVKIDEDSTIYKVVSDAADLLDHKIIFDSVDSETMEVLKSKKLTSEMRQETPFDTIKWALSLAGCVFSIGVNTLKGKENERTGKVILVRKLSSLYNQQSKYTFIQWRNIDHNASIPQAPCYSFNIDSGRSLFFNGFSFGSYRLGDDPFKKKVIVEEAVRTQPITEIDPNGTTAMKPDTKAAVKAGRFVPVREDTEPGKEATSDVEKSEVEMALINFQKFSLEAPGIPNLAPMDMVELMVGDIEEFSGKMMVTGVTHTFDSDGWNMTLETRKTGGLQKS